jgi:predicted CoA-binding protein
MDPRHSMELSYDDHKIRDVLEGARIIAMVGASPKRVRDSFEVMAFLQRKGYRVIPVNPAEAGSQILGETVYSSLDAIPGDFQMVDIFRHSKATGPIVDDAIALAGAKGIQSIWMQLDVRNDIAAAQAEAAGLDVIMDRCPYIEYRRLYGDTNWCDARNRN